MKRSIMSKLRNMQNYNVFTESRINLLEHKMEEYVQIEKPFDIQDILASLDVDTKHRDQITFYLINPESVWNYEDLILLAR